MEKKLDNIRTGIAAVCDTPRPDWATALKVSFNKPLGGIIPIMGDMRLLESAAFLSGADLLKAYEADDTVPFTFYGGFHAYNIFIPVIGRFDFGAPPNLGGEIRCEVVVYPEDITEPAFPSWRVSSVYTKIGVYYAEQATHTKRFAINGSRIDFDYSTNTVPAIKNITDTLNMTQFFSRYCNNDLGIVSIKLDAGANTFIDSNDYIAIAPSTPTAMALGDPDVTFTSANKKGNLQLMRYDIIMYDDSDYDPNVFAVASSLSGLLTFRVRSLLWE